MKPTNSNTNIVKWMDYLKIIDQLTQDFSLINATFKSCATTIVSSSSVQQLYLSCPLYGVTTLTATLCPQLLMSDWSIMGGMFGCRAQWYYNYLIIVLLPLFAGVHSTMRWAPTVVFTFAAGHNGHWTLFKIVLLCTHQHLTLPSPSPQTFNS